MKGTLRILAALIVLLGVTALAAPLMAQEKVVVEERTATILKVSGTTVILRNDKGEIHKYNGIPENVTMYIDGQPAKLHDLHEGMKVQAVRFQDVPPPVTITMSEVEQPAPPPAKHEAAPAPVAEPAPAPEPVAAPEPAKTLPPTASNWPNIALLGLALALSGMAIRAANRRRT